MKSEAYFLGIGLISFFAAIVVFCIILLIDIKKNGSYSRKIPMPPAKLNPKNKF